VLRHIVLYPEGYQRVRVWKEQTHALRDPNPSIRHIAITFYCPYVKAAAVSS
jgi:hypothetical protein